MVVQCLSLGDWRDRQSYKEAAESANVEAANKSLSELNTTKHRANKTVQVQADAEDLKCLSACYVGETYAINQVNIVEKSSGETIFACGDDRERILRPEYPLHPKHSSTTKCSGSPSAIPCSLLDLKDCSGQGVPE
ncbi:hypothetical protein Ancab_015853 [Ancistrocladus abbreviatus]